MGFEDFRVVEQTLRLKPQARLNQQWEGTRLVRTGLEANGGICRSLLQVRHGLATDPEEVRG